MKIYKYELVTGMTLESLEFSVNHRLHEWIPIGGPFVENRERYSVFVQAIGKITPNEKNYLW